MLKKLAIYFALIILITSLTGCAAFRRFQSRRTEGGVGTTPSLEVASILRFSDIPVPSGFKIKPEESYTFQTDTFRDGLLKYTGSANPQVVVNFYKEQMPQYNWQLVNLIEYGRSLLNFEKQDQSCTIIVEGGVTRTAITIHLSPKSKKSTPLGAQETE